MKRHILFLGAMLLLSSFGTVQAETTTETCTESYSEETSQLNKKNERAYFDDVFELVSETDRDYLFLAKDMTWYNLSGGSTLFASYGTYTIKNGIVTLTEEYSDSPDGGNNVYKYNIKYKGSDIFLSDTDKEYKICNVENKEKIFGDVIELRRKHKGMQQQIEINDCEEKTQRFEKFVDDLYIAEENKSNGAENLKKFADLLKQSEQEKEFVKECREYDDYKTRIFHAFLRCNVIVCKYEK